MDKQTLSIFGWIVVVIVLIAVVIAFTTPFGEYIKSTLYTTANAFMQRSDIDEANDISVTQSENGTVSVDAPNCFAGNTVKLTVSPNENYIYNGATITKPDGSIIYLDKTQTSFVMPDANISVTANFSKQTSSRVITNSATSAIMMYVYDNKTAVISGTGTIDENTLFVIGDVDTLIIKKGITGIYAKALDISCVKTLSIPRSVEIIHSGAFVNASLLSSVLVDNIRSNIIIENNAFVGSSISDENITFVQPNT